MATQVQLRRGTATENDAFTGAQGELTFDTTNKRVRIHDGATAGGFELKTENSSGDTLFADNEKAIFGAGSDLQIYHDGTHSYIKDAGTGNLRILGANIAISNAAGTENHIVCYDNGAVELSYDDVTKIATTSTGINVTGTVTADALTVDGVGSISTGSSGGSAASNADDFVVEAGGDGGISILTPSTNTGTLFFGDSSASNAGQIKYSHSAGSFSFVTEQNTRMTIDNSGKVGIGTSSPKRQIHLHNTSAASTKIQITNSATGSGSDGEGFQIGIGGSGQAVIEQRENQPMEFYTNNTERMRIDSSGNVGIGCVPSSIQSGFDTLQIGGNLTLNVDSTGAGAGVYMGNNVYRDSNNSRWEYIYTDEATQYVQANGEHIWRYAASGTANYAIGWSEAMRIDSSGRLMLGTTTEGQTQADNFTIADSGNMGMTLRSTDSGETSIFFSDGTSGTAEYAGWLQYVHSSDAMTFGINATEKMRIDSSGNLLVGKTSASATVVGVMAKQDGFLGATSDGDFPLLVNRLTSDGDIAVFRKDGTTVGSIGTSGGYTKITSGNGTFGSGLIFNNVAINPVNAAGSVADATVKLGDTTSRFTDLYLSGGVYLGGTGSANKLDDYEEGTFNATLLNVTATLNSSACRYTKIGNIVHIFGNIDVATLDTADGSSLTVGNLPFSASSNGFSHGTFVRGYNKDELFPSSTATDVTGIHVTNSNSLNFNRGTGTGTNPFVTYTLLNTSGEFSFGVTYTTNS